MKLLFQGDSITDALRFTHDDPRSTGQGYVRLLEMDMTYADPNALFYNCAVSGNRVTDLLSRWKRDCINLQPDVLTILVGVNDICQEHYHNNGVHTELYRQVYRLLLQEVKAAVPNVKIILMTPFLLHGSLADGNWDIISEGVDQRAQVVRQLAEEWQTSLVDLQKVFAEAQDKLPAGHWSSDGVHPTAAGHKLIADAWSQVYQSENSQ